MKSRLDSAVNSIWNLGHTICSGAYQVGANLARFAEYKLIGDIRHMSHNYLNKKAVEDKNQYHVAELGLFKLIGNVVWLIPKSKEQLAYFLDKIDTLKHGRYLYHGAKMLSGGGTFLMAETEGHGHLQRTALRSAISDYKKNITTTLDLCAILFPEGKEHTINSKKVSFLIKNILFRNAFGLPNLMLKVDESQLFDIFFENVKTTDPITKLTLFLPEKYSFRTQLKNKFKNAVIGILMRYKEDILKLLQEEVKNRNSTNKRFFKTNNFIVPLIIDQIEKDHPDFIKNPNQLIAYLNDMNAAQLEHYLQHPEIISPVGLLSASHALNKTTMAFLHGIGIKENSLLQEFLVHSMVSLSVPKKLDSKSIDLKEINGMDFLNVCYQESLRIANNGITQIFRYTSKEIERDGVKIPANSYITFDFKSNNFSFAHHLNFDAGVMHELHELKKLNRCSNLERFTPFSAGKRSCPGEQFSGVVLKTLILYLLNHFVIEDPDEHHNFGLTPRAVEARLEDDSLNSAARPAANF